MLGAYVNICRRKCQIDGEIDYYIFFLKNTITWSPRLVVSGWRRANITLDIMKCCIAFALIMWSLNRDVILKRTFRSSVPSTLLTNWAPHTLKLKLISSSSQPSWRLSTVTWCLYVPALVIILRSSPTLTSASMLGKSMALRQHATPLKEEQASQCLSCTEVSPWEASIVHCYHRVDRVRHPLTLSRPQMHHQHLVHFAEELMLFSWRKCLS